MNIFIKASAVLLAILLISPAFAGPREITYQGQLYESDAAVTATKYFQFALLTNDIVAWQSQGIGTGRVALQVTKGFFSVRLGDATIANMAALPADLFNSAVDVYLQVRVGSTAGDTLQVLSPSNKITSAAYAISPPIALTNGTAMYGGAPTVIVMTGSPLLTTPVWDDLRVPLDNAGYSSATVIRPSYNPLGTTKLYLYDFDKAKDESMNFTTQIPHTYKAGTYMCPHIHWINKYTQTISAASTNVVWGLEYQVKWIDEQYSSSVSTTILCTNGVPTTLNTHMLSELPRIPGTGIKESAIIVGRVFRAGSNLADTYNQDATILEIDFHFQVNKMGSVNEIPD